MYMRPSLYLSLDLCMNVCVCTHRFVYVCISLSVCVCVCVCVCKCEGVSLCKFGVKAGSHTGSWAARNAPVW